jgi:hypothetical protein
VDAFWRKCVRLRFFVHQQLALYIEVAHAARCNLFKCFRSYDATLRNGGRPCIWSSRRSCASMRRVSVRSLCTGLGLASPRHTAIAASNAVARSRNVSTGFVAKCAMDNKMRLAEKSFRHKAPYVGVLLVAAEGRVRYESSSMYGGIRATSQKGVFED